MIASFVVVAAALLTLLPALALVPGISVNHIFARQSLDPNIIPTSCLSTACQAVENDVSKNCTTLQCLCSTAIYTDLKSCYQCAVNAGGSFTQADSDLALNGFSGGCAAGGFAIPGASTLSGSTPVATSLGGGANTATATSAATAATAANTATGLPKSGAASKISVGSFGVIVVAALGAVALL